MRLHLSLLWLVALVAACCCGALPASAQPPPPRAASRVFDLAGATLQAFTCEQEQCTLMWHAPTSLYSSDAPPTVHTVRAEWSEADVRQSIVACQVHSIASVKAADTMTCNISRTLLPSDASITLQLLSECDYQRAHELAQLSTAGASAAPPRCISGLAASMVVSVADALKPARFKHGSAVLASPGVSQLHDDDSLRETLCDFFHATNGPQWNHSTGWCDPLTPVCNWYGLTCDWTSTNVTALSLFANGLLSTTLVDLNPVLSNLPSLLLLDLSFNYVYLSDVDLRPLTQLQAVRLGFLPQVLSGQRLILPPMEEGGLASLTQLDLSASYWRFNSSCLPSLSELSLNSYQPLFQFQTIWRFPLLTSFSAPKANLVSTTPAMDGSRLSGGDLTHFILSNLYRSNPLLRSLDISGTLLSFDTSVSRGPDNWPSNMRAPLLQQLSLSYLPQLRTAPGGPLDSWLSGLPSLLSLDLSGLPGARLSTKAFLYATSPGIMLLTATSTSVSGDLADLCHLHQLSVLQLDETGLESLIPTNVDACWPSLTVFSVCCSELWGNVPSFGNLPSLLSIRLQENNLIGYLDDGFVEDSPGLMNVDLSLNYLSGPVPDFSSNPLLVTLQLDFNNFGASYSMDPPQGGDAANNNVDSGTTAQGAVGDALFPLPEFKLGLLNTLSLQSNVIEGTLPDSFWANLPSLKSLDLSNNMLQGTHLDMPLPPVARVSHVSSALLTRSCSSSSSLSSSFPSGLIPSSPVPMLLDYFSLSNNNFVGQMPANLSSTYFDVSYNYLSGPLTSFAALPYASSIVTLILGGQAGDSDPGNLTCPIWLGGLDSLRTLDVHNSGFVGCDFSDPTEVQLPSQLTSLDISYNAWAPLLLNIQPSIQLLMAESANIYGFDRMQPGLSLQKLYLENNALAWVTPLGDIQLVQWANLLSVAPSISVIDCGNCSLKMDLSSFLPLLSSTGSRPLFQELKLDNNQLTGSLPATLFASNKGVMSLPRALQILDISGNVGVGGQLPMASAYYGSLTSINLSNTSISGDLGYSWGQFNNLQQLSLENTTMECGLTVSDYGELQCELPPWLRVRATETGSNGSQTRNYHCPSLAMASQEFSLVQLSDEYHAKTLCACDSNFWGKDGKCVQCPDACTCSQDMVQNCYPVIESGRVHVDQSGFVLMGWQITSFAIRTMLPCPRTTTGASLCNPRGIPWVDFYEVNEIIFSDVVGDGGQLESRMTIRPRAKLGDSDDDGDDDYSDPLRRWCYRGHTGRLCSQCSSGFFASGRWCLECLNQAGHVMLLLLNIAFALGVVVFLFRKSPGPGVAAAELNDYIQRMGQQEEMQKQRAMVLATTMNPARLTASGMPASDSTEWSSGGGLSGSVSGSVQMSMLAAPSSAASAANPAKLMVFFSQQLAILLRTSTSLPATLASLLTAVSVAGSSFSLSSLFALECLNGAWSLSSQCWAALAGPALVGLAALIIAAWHKRNVPPRLGSGAPDSVEDYAQLVHRAAIQSKASRAYGVCLSVLYLLAFPSAFTALSALTCTDLREWNLDSARMKAQGFETGSSSDIYLNLYPSQKCDAAWASHTLPPALIGVLFWFLVFPFASTWFFRRMRRQAMAPPSREMGGGEAAKAVAAWPICSDLLLPFTPKWWFWEQVLLARRLMLVILVCVIPSDSVFLPLALLLLFEISALLQHYAQPYRHAALNAGELASLYLLLLNYISSVVFQTSFSIGADGFGRSEDMWAGALFIANLVFLVGLLGAMSSRARSATVATIATVQAWMGRRGWGSGAPSTSSSYAGNHYTDLRSVSPVSSGAYSAYSSPPLNPTVSPPPPMGDASAGVSLPPHVSVASPPPTLKGHRPLPPRTPGSLASTLESPMQVPRSVRPARAMRDSSGVLRQMDVGNDHSLLSGPSFSGVGVGTPSVRYFSGRNSPSLGSHVAAHNTMPPVPPSDEHEYFLNQD